MVTLLSIACGFASIVISVDNAPVGDADAYRLAAALLVLAGVFDALDGYVARLTNTSSQFGVQLDSIADVMNFGCAPAVLLYCYGFVQMGVHDPLLLRFGGMASFFFVACGAMRLARFNVNVGRTDPLYFVGMPITAGAACVAAVVVASGFRDDTRVALYVTPIWFAILLIGYHFIEKHKGKTERKGGLREEPEPAKELAAGISEMK